MLRTTEPQFALALVELSYETGAHDIYQLLYALRDGELELDGLDEPQLARELVSAMRSGLTLQGAEGIVEFRPIEGFAGLGRELSEARSIAAEQSNTSIVFDDELILKVFRRLEAGINPELEMLRFLTEHGFANIAALGGWYQYSGGPISATLGILQQFVRDGNRRLGARARRDRERARRVPRAAAPARRGDGLDAHGARIRSERSGVRSRDAERRGARPAHRDRRRGDRADVRRPAAKTTSGSHRSSDAAKRCASSSALLTHSGSAGKSIRTHGDYHLGQTLWADGRLGDPRLRRRAGPLAAPSAAASARRCATSPGCCARSRTPPPSPRRPRHDVPETAGRSRRASSSSPATSRRSTRRCCPSGQLAIERLLAVYELEKAVYELRYELDNRPEWVGIPVAGISRLIDQAAATS